MNKRSINEFLATVVIILAFVAYANCQKVEVDQSFVNDAEKAFTEVVALRATVEAFKTERAKTDTERAAADTLIKSFDALIKVKDQISVEKDKIIALYERVIELQSKMLDTLEKRLLKPKSFFQKMLATLKDIALVVAGIALGRGGL